MSAIESGYSFLQTGDITLTNFSSTDAIVYFSDKVPRNHKGIIRDLGIIFSTIGGSVYLARRTISGSELRITGNISDTATGLGSIVLDEGERILIKLGSTGTGVINSYDDGIIQRKINPNVQFEPIINPDMRGRGGF